MNFDFNEIKMDTVVKTAEKEAAVRTSVSESESGVVTKILDVSADGKIISLDNQNGAARASRCFSVIRFVFRSPFPRRELMERRGVSPSRTRRATSLTSRILRLKVTNGRRSSGSSTCRRSKEFISIRSISSQWQENRSDETPALHF